VHNTRKKSHHENNLLMQNVDRLRLDNNHQQPILEEGKPSVAPNEQRKKCRQCGCEDFQGGECASLAKNNYRNLAVYFY
jgi:hypothetical protein